VTDEATNPRRSRPVRGASSATAALASLAIHRPAGRPADRDRDTTRGRGRRTRP
jgi:hypothetical protein